MTREEMIEQAKETRKHVTNATVSPEEMAAYPVVMEKLSVPTSVGDAAIYYSYAENGANLDVMIINFHGGGFIRERTPNDELFCRKLNHVLGCRIMDVDYRIAPDYPYPIAFNESYDVICWMFAHAGEYGVDPQKIILMGHSAGGNLILGTTMRAIAEKSFHPLGLVVEYPPLDLYTDPDDKPRQGKGIPAERARLYNLYYCDRERQKEPYASPYYASQEQLTGFPPCAFLTAGLDDLCTEAEDLALRMAQAGNEITIKRFPNAGHAFTIYRKPGHQEAFDLMVRYVKNMLLS